MVMPKTKATLQKSKQELSHYKFDTSSYIIFDSGARRDGHTGKLVMHSSDKKAPKQKRK